MYSPIIVSAMLLSLALAAPLGDADRPVGVTFTVHADELGGSNPAYAARIQAREVWGIAAYGCAESQDPLLPVGVAFQVYDIQPARTTYSDRPWDTNLADTAALAAFSSTVLTYDPREGSGPNVLATLPGGIEPTAHERGGRVRMCFGMGEPVSPVWDLDAVFVVAFQNAVPKTADVEIRLVGASSFTRTWEASEPDAAHFVVPRDMVAPMAEANGFPAPVPLLSRGGVQAGGSVHAEAARGVYGSLGYLWGTGDGAYAVLGPQVAYPACSIQREHPCPAGLLPAEQFAGGAGTYELVNLASRSTFTGGLSAFWADLPLPEGIVAPAAPTV